jgi:hypothetical protein
MEKTYSTPSEREVAEKINNLHDCAGLDFRRICNAFWEEDIEIGKDKANRLYWKYKTTNSDQLSADKELKKLKKREDRVSKRLHIRREKDLIRRNIVSLEMQELAKSYEKRNLLF